MSVPAGLEAIYAFVSHLELHIKNNFEEFIHSLSSIFLNLLIMEDR